MVAFVDQEGKNVGVKFSSVAASEAHLVFQACATVLNGRKSRVVTAEAIGDNRYTTTTTTDGGDNMETRIAVIEASVGHIKADITTLKDDVGNTKADISEVKRDVAVILQKLVDIDTNLSKKPSTSEVSAAIATATNKQIIWTIGIAMAILGLAKFMF
ncbi:TPA: hypothetical protein ACHQNL_001376 [Serratia marcescens]|uniref:hypothetical protein n=1 Tax=Serratia TaxID=613 RepID=UPI00215B5B71|nr:hypothetical protein [Serratia marcescens]MDS0779143.1 hypothetical protein [Serratia marcescens]